jgi:thiamine-monophosphate kinase
MPKSKKSNKGNRMDARLKKLGEFGLIDRLVTYLPELPANRWVVGIGDDASVLRLSENHYQLLTHDLLLEGVHFILQSRADFAGVGWKALAVNLSDIAAMGAVPQEAVVGLGIPARGKVAEAEAIYKGLGECAREFHCKVVGGDISFSKGGWVIAVSVTGFSPRLPKLRTGAATGDSLWVTGTLGGAALGWRARKKKIRSRAVQPFLKKQQRPTPRVMWGQRLGESPHVTAMMDISDGLAGDLSHLARYSGVGFEVDVEKIPRLDGFEKICRSLKVKPLECLLGGGEDYELLFTVGNVSEKVFSQWLIKKNICATPIGRVVKNPEIFWLLNGRPTDLKIQGYRHF